MPRIALILGSTRTPSAGPVLAGMITSIFTPLLPADTSLTTIDLKEHPIPLYTSGAPPAGLKGDNPYPDAQTNAWSALIRSFDGFIFLTPQYNWGFPAPLKLALDALYYEWKAKPALVVSYGSHGGGKGNAQLRQVLTGLHMRLCEKFVELEFAKAHDLAGGEIEKETEEKWRAEEKRKELKQAWEVFVASFAAAT
uniref:NAD(P)H-dependent FMN reductase n=1 Tax=Mycena chlorophos TaxID=658473 RepID=A0ABQ0LUE5_MYCCL|nr:NAD(P)H-dependent FMN reductase [Mycena chlorophos]